MIADEIPELREKAEIAGYNFMPWTLPGNKGYLIYRNLLTKGGKTAPYSLNKTPMPNFATNRSHLYPTTQKNTLELMHLLALG